MAATCLTFIGLIAGGTAALHMRANAETPPVANPPVAVKAQTLSLAGSYDVIERFAGRLEPARQTNLSFERAGLVREVRAEEGQKVMQGDIIARLDFTKLEAEKAMLKAQHKELEARQALAKATLKRQDELNKQGWRSAQKFDEARFNLQALNAGLNRIQASIASLDVDIGKSVLTAPFDGTIASRSIDEGAVVGAGTNVVELLESGRRQVRIGVSVEAAEGLKPDQTYGFAANGRQLTGTVIAKRPDLENRTRTMSILFEVQDAQSVPFGEIVELLLTRQVAVAGAWLPLTALTEGRKGLWSVLTVVPGEHGPVIALEAAEVLHVEGKRAFVRGTFGDGAQIVLQGTNRVTPGQRVALAGEE